MPLDEQHLMADLAARRRIDSELAEEGGRSQIVEGGAQAHLIDRAGSADSSEQQEACGISLGGGIIA